MCVREHARRGVACARALGWGSARAGLVSGASAHLGCMGALQRVSVTSSFHSVFRGRLPEAVRPLQLARPGGRRRPCAGVSVCVATPPPLFRNSSRVPTRRRRFRAAPYRAHPQSRKQPVRRSRFVCLSMVPRSAPLLGALRSRLYCTTARTKPPAWAGCVRSRVQRGGSRVRARKRDDEVCVEGERG